MSQPESPTLLDRNIIPASQPAHTVEPERESQAIEAAGGEGSGGAPGGVGRTVRKRLTSLGNDSSQMTAASVDVNKRFTGRPRRQRGVSSMEQELCVFCGVADVSLRLVQCECCDQYYHTLCCGVPAAHCDLARELLQIMGWTCKA